MSTSTLDTTKEITKPAETPAQAQLTQAERRRRKRIKISGQVHVRVKNSPATPEELCKSIDVSRDGVLFSSTRADHYKGQLLDVTFPYSAAAGSLNQARPAEIVRIANQGDSTFAIAVQFQVAKDTIKTISKRAGSVPFATGPGERTPSTLQAKPMSVVLAVEPDPAAAEMMRNILRPDGYTTVIVPDAKAALEVLRTTVPSALIAEVEGVPISGQDLCMIIKGDDRLKGVPVILIVRSDKNADYTASHQLGAVVCMAKPFKPEKLLNVVRLVAPPLVIRSAYGTGIGGGMIERTL
jgi:CheY-like chemotaxis protein